MEESSESVFDGVMCTRSTGLRCQTVVCNQLQIDIADEFTFNVLYAKVVFDAFGMEEMGQIGIAHIHLDIPDTQVRCFFGSKTDHGAKGENQGDGGENAQNHVFILSGPACRQPPP